MLNLPNRRKPIETETNENGCILITSHYRRKDGHVMVRINGKTVYLHRYVYEQENGVISEDLVIRHKCDNPHCINLEHLELGTHKDNVEDRVERNRSAKGSVNGRSKLTEENILFIRASEGVTQVELAKMFDVSEKAIRNILSYKTWKHVK